MSPEGLESSAVTPADRRFALRSLIGERWPSHLACLFLAAAVWFHQDWLSAAAALACGAIAVATRRRRWYFFFLFALGWLAYNRTLAWWPVPGITPPSLSVCLSRFALLPWIVLPLLAGLGSRGGMTWLRPGAISRTVSLPAPWQGKRPPLPAWAFTLLACAVTASAFIPFARAESTLLGFSLIFATINAPLEEILWRGVIQSRLGPVVGERSALFWQALLFGAAHATLGFDWWVCGLFAIGGLVFGVLARRTRGLALPTALHWTADVCFGMTGILFS
jgi:membrane protease YdiL (CAAX protease family)